MQLILHLRHGTKGRLSKISILMWCILIVHRSIALFSFALNVFHSFELQLSLEINFTIPHEASITTGHAWQL